MSLKRALRGVLPSTNRNFEERMAVLEEKLDVVLRENQMLHEAIGRIYDIADRQRYFNGEYLLPEGVPSKKVLVAGWYGAGNFGDELMLRTVLRLVPEQCLGRTYVLLCCTLIIINEYIFIFQ